MAVKITINSREVKNPVARFFIAVAGLAVFLVVFVLLFFLLLPFVWFLALSLILLSLAAIALGPKLVTKYRVIMLERESPQQKK